MIALLSSRDAAALVAVERVEDTEAFRGVDLLNLGPASCLVYEIQLGLDFSDASYTRAPVEAFVPGKPHLVSPGETYRVLDEKVLGSVRESSPDDWVTTGLGELTLQVRYVPGTERLLKVTLMVDAKEDSLELKLLPADRGAMASLID
jgi:hypothetical protein